jgi:hypothetical protein
MKNEPVNARILMKQLVIPIPINVPRTDETAEIRNGVDVFALNWDK